MTRRRLTEEEIALWRKVTARAEAMHPETAIPDPLPAPKPRPKPKPQKPALAQSPSRTPTPVVRPVLNMDRKTFGRMTRGKLKPERRIDLHGMTVEQALEVVDKYLDDALLAGLYTVRLIHGVGTLALRDAIGRHLRNRPGVASFGPGDPTIGGIGVTVVQLED